MLSMRPPLIVLIACLALFTGGASQTDTRPLIIEGRANVVNGNTIEIGGQSIQIWGISVPPPASDDGERAKEHLRRLIADVTVECRTVESTSFRYLVAQCFAGGIDIAWPLVLTGYATDNTRQSNGYYARPN